MGCRGPQGRAALALVDAKLQPAGPRPQGRAPLAPTMVGPCLHDRYHAALAKTRATVVPSSDGLGATMTPASWRISTFSSALSPKAEMMAPAWPMRRPLGAVRPAM